MNSLIQFKETTPLFFVAFVLGCFALPPQARAACQNGCDASNFNTFLGEDALVSNTTGFSNTAIGFHALISNTTGFENTAIGVNTLVSNTTGRDITANGAGALFNNTTGNFNTANGAAALQVNTTGNNNTATGLAALLFNQSGNNNTAEGDFTLFNNTTGSNNIALGHQAGQNLTKGDNNIDIGNGGVADEANTIRIGTLETQTAIYVAGIMGKTVPHSTPVFVNADGKLGTTPSSARFKTKIKAMDRASEALLALKPVTFRYKKEIDPDRTPQFGLVAEDVEKINPDLVLRDSNGKPYTVRYDAVNAMLLNEFLKEHKTVQEQGATIARQQKQIKALAAGLQKVSAQLEVSKPAPQTVANSQ